MIKFIKDNWDIILGGLIGIGLAVLSKFETSKIQLYYSVIILILVSIGILRIFKQAFNNKKRKHNLVDNLVDGNITAKALNLAEHPEEEGEKVGKTIINFLEVTKMTKLKEFFSKFKGYMLTISLAILTVVEMCGGFFNELCNGALTIKGVEVLPLITLVLTAVVGILSNGYTKEQREKIKALFSKKVTNELVLTEIRKTIKENTEKLNQFNKILKTKETELANFETELENAQNTHEAKQAMLNMVPQLATAEDVQLAVNEVVNVEAKINEKKKEIADTQTSIANLTTTINALKAQL